MLATDSIRQTVSLPLRPEYWLSSPTIISVKVVTTRLDVLSSRILGRCAFELISAAKMQGIMSFVLVFPTDLK